MILSIKETTLGKVSFIGLLSDSPWPQKNACVYWGNAETWDIDIGKVFL